MDENKVPITSTYGGRKIRIEGQTEGRQLLDSIMEDVSDKTGLTFGRACSNGLIKPGMIVVFKDCNFGPIDLDEEMTGLNQQVAGMLSKGVVVKEKDGKFAVFALLKLTSFLSLKGRYGRANESQTINNVISTISTKIKRCTLRLLTTTEFVDLCNDNDLVLSYFRNENLHVRSLFDSAKGRCYLEKRSLNCEYLVIVPGRKIHDISEMAVIIEGDTMECCLKQNSVTTITELHSFRNNPYNMHVEIRG